MDVIGAANEFWRLRITRVETPEGLDFEWHDDILYRTPEVTPAEEVEQYLVEAVSLDSADVVETIACFHDRGQADEFLAATLDDLRDMTRSQFEDAYLSAEDDQDLAD